ncbi:BlaI/MecI/CopY family transcriptional regulator [Candidatus Woesearchaeota archaeon]|nr:BlaI/MecI/CopY family transcriptional regulator [Candidatus Woesearchaeota archaeon]
MKEIQEKLIGIGLSKAQAVIYTALLKLNRATVKQIAEESGFHRTNIYDIMDELKEKGLVTYYKEGKSTYYTAVDPKRLFTVLEEKKEVLKKAMPELEKVFHHTKEKIEVQIYKGQQGMKSAWNNLVKHKNITYYGIMVRGQLRRELPVFAKQLIRKINEQNIKYKGLYTEDFGKTRMNKEVRYVHPKYSTPVSTHVYKDMVLIQIWSPEMMAIEIKSQRIADAYKDQFNMLWKDASKKPLE